MFDKKRQGRRNFLQLSSVAMAGAALAACQSAAPVATQNPPAASPTPEKIVANGAEALTRLQEGNARYVANKTTDVNESEARRVAVAKGQNPFATVFSCVDSRVPPELVFDRGLGDLFVIRTAGQVIDKAVLGSLEFGVAELKIPLLLVLGHSKCGACKAALETIEHNGKAEHEINDLVEGIRPAVEKSQGMAGDALANAVKTDVELTVARLKGSPILSDAVKEGKLKVVGGIYDLDTGRVEITAT